MKWKSRKPKWGETITEKEFLFLPRKLNGYWYWLEWGMVKYMWIGHRWTRGELVKILPSND